MAEITIEDARRLHDAGFARSVLDAIREERQAKCLIGFFGESGKAFDTLASAPSPRLLTAADAWAVHLSVTFESKPELMRPLGSGTAGIIGIEADGTARCVTWSRNKADCAGLKGWADEAVFPFLAAVPFRTHFGWGNGGVPIPLTSEERAQVKAQIRPAFWHAWLDEDV